MSVYLIKLVTGHLHHVSYHVLRLHVVVHLRVADLEAHGRSWYNVLAWSSTCCLLTALMWSTLITSNALSPVISGY